MMARRQRLSTKGPLLAVALVLLWASSAEAAPKKKKKIDLEALEKEWERGDSEEELMTDQKLKMKKMEAARRQQPQFDPDNPQEFIKAGGGVQQVAPVMLFADLHKTSPLFGELTNSRVDDLIGSWKDKLMSGGIKAQVYNVEDGKALISVDKQTDSFDVKDFLLEQPEVDFVTLNSQKYYPPKKGGSAADL